MTDITEKLAALDDAASEAEDCFAPMEVDPRDILDLVAHIRTLEQERDTTATDLYDELMDARKERDEAQAELKRLREQEPVAWVPRSSLESLHSDGSRIAVRTAIHRVPLKSGNGVPLYAGPKPAKESDHD